MKGQSSIEGMSVIVDLGREKGFKGLSVLFLLIGRKESKRSIEERIIL